MRIFPAWLFVVAVLSLTPIALVSCDGKKNELRFATVASDWFNAPFTLALEDYDGSDGLIITQIDFSSGLASKTAILSGHADIGLAALPPLLRDPNALRQIVILACYMRSDAVIGLATSNPEAPFEGRVGFVEGSISEIYLSELARSLSQVTVGELDGIGIRPPDGVTLLRNGSIQTASIWEPHLSLASQIDGVTILRPRDIYEVSVCAIARRETAFGRSRDIDDFVTRLERAGQHLASDPSTSRERVQRLLPGSNVIPNEVWDFVDFTVVTDPTDIAERLEREAAALERAGFLNGSTDYHGLLNYLQ